MKSRPPDCVARFLNKLLVENCVLCTHNSYFDAYRNYSYSSIKHCINL